MKEKFEELYESVKKDRRHSNWSKKNTFKQRLDELVNEVEEVKQALEKDDLANLREELGDVLWDVMFLIYMAEEEELFTGKEVISEIIEKFKRRKPWIFENKDIHPDEEVRLWNEAKKLEKENKLS